MTDKPTTTIHKAFGLEDKFYIVENKTVQDKTISFELIGLIAYLSSLPKNWKINAGDIMRTGCGRGKAYKLLGQLEELGFIKRETIRHDDGTAKAFTIEFYAMREENPKYETPSNHQLIVLQDVAEQDVDNRLLQSKEVKKEKKGLSAQGANASKQKEKSDAVLDSDFAKILALLESALVMTPHYLGLLKEDAGVYSVQEWASAIEIFKERQRIEKIQIPYKYLLGILRGKAKEVQLVSDEQDAIKAQVTRGMQHTIDAAAAMDARLAEIKAEKEAKDDAA
jgi:hypothetical protein